MPIPDPYQVHREHKALQAECDRLLREHRGLHRPPFDAAAHQTHHRALQAFLIRLRNHRATIRAKY